LSFLLSENPLPVMLNFCPTDVTSIGGERKWEVL